jgi:hypothetical protein
MMFFYVSEVGVFRINVIRAGAVHGKRALTTPLTTIGITTNTNINSAI